tara:strand:+ start:741 stop:944 length:204 start_codon:yes stop_codon:yes gene_type:complete
MKNYQKIYNDTKNKGSVKFTYQGQKFRTFIDWEKDFCLTHYSTNGENAWLVGDAKGLEIKLNNLINI